MPTYIDSPFGPIDLEAREAQPMSGISILNPAIKGSYKGSPTIVLGFDDTGSTLVVDVDGKMSRVPLKDVQLDWRYDFKNEKWVDSEGESLEVEA